MNLPLYTGAAHLNVLENWQATIANNLANVSTPGFQKNSFQVASAEKPLTREPLNNHPLTPLPVGRPVRVFSDGEIRVTGNPNDFAIHGGGFFGMRDEAGQEVYSKDGSFQINAEGILVNKLGWPVLAEGGELALRQDGGPFTVHMDGTVTQDGENIGRISVYQFTNPNQLERGNGSYFYNPDNLAGVNEVEIPTIMQGQLMGSAVSPLSEMVSMIQASRSYELTQKVIQENDDRGQKIIQAFSV
jgi:flagellar basal body rod protein FlgG